MTMTTPNGGDTRGAAVTAERIPTLREACQAAREYRSAYERVLAALDAALAREERLRDQLTATRCELHEARLPREVP